MYLLASHKNVSVFSCEVIKKLFNLNYFKHMDVSPACIHVHHKLAWCQLRSEEGARYPGTGVTDGYELPNRCWELDPSPLQEQPALLTAEPAPQCHEFE